MLKITTYLLKSFTNVKSIFVNNIIFIILISLYFFMVLFTDSLVYSTKNKVDLLLKDNNNISINVKNDIGVVLGNNDNYKEVYIKKVTKDYFTSDILKFLSISNNDVEKIFSNKKRTQVITSKLFNYKNAAILTSSSKRGTVVEINNIFDTGLSIFDKNIIFICYENLDNINDLQFNNNILDEIYSRFYSSVNSSLQSIKLLNVFLLFLSIFFSFSIASSFLYANSKYIKFLYFEGISLKKLLFISIFITTLFIIIILSISFILIVILVKFTPTFLMMLEKYFSLNFNYYLKNFTLFINYNYILKNISFLVICNLIYNLIKNHLYLSKMKNDRIF